jgi:hypothetical protein
VRQDERGRLVGASLTLFGLLLIGLPVGVLAQSPSAAPSQAESQAAMPFPTTLAGQALDVRTYTGTEWLAESSAASPDSAAFASDTQAMLASVGATVDDLSVASALVEPTPGTQAVILGLQVQGVDARRYVEQSVGLLLGDIEEPRLVLRPVGSRWVLRVVDAAIPGVYPRTVYLDGDTAWYIGADEAYVQELLEQLPAQAAAASGDDASLVSTLPVILDGQRRTGLYEAREPLVLPTFDQRLGPAMEAWLLDLYLDEGIAPSDLLGAIAWWGIDGEEQGVEVEGYQVPGAPPEMLERLRTQVLLGDGSALPDEVSRVEQELGGHAVTTIDFGYSTQHVLSSGDTVWVVTDYAGEPAVAEEAVAALP